MQHIDLADLLLIAEAATGIPVDQLKRDVDVALAEAALAAPFSGIADREFFPTTEQKIAVLGYRLARYHAFTDGNKRTARVAMRLAANLSGYTWTDVSEDDAVEMMERAAAGTVTEDEFAAWVRQRLT